MNDEEYRRALILLPICAGIVCLCALVWQIPNELSGKFLVRWSFLIATLGMAGALFCAMIVEDAERRKGLRSILIMVAITYVVFLCERFRIIVPDTFAERSTMHIIIGLPVGAIHESWKLWHKKSDG